MPDNLAESWRNAANKEQVIALAEMFPILLCRAMVIKPSMTMLAVHYVDNDGVADGLIHGMRPVDSLRDMLYEFALQDSSRNLVSWIARVASASNAGDAPSRTKVMPKDGLDRGLDRSPEAREVAYRFAQLLIKRRAQ